MHGLATADHCIDSLRWAKLEGQHKLQVSGSRYDGAYLGSEGDRSGEL